MFHPRFSSQVKVPFPILRFCLIFMKLSMSFCNWLRENISGYLQNIWATGRQICTFQLVGTLYCNTYIGFTNLSPSFFSVHKFVTPVVLRVLNKFVNLYFPNWLSIFAKFCICWNVPCFLRFLRKYAGFKIFGGNLKIRSKTFTWDTVLTASCSLQNFVYMV